MNNPKKLCDICNREITNNNFSKHYISCSNPKKKKIRGIDYDPNAGYKNGTRKIWNKGLTKETHPAIAKYAKTNSDNMKSGKTPKPIICTNGYLGSAQHRKDSAKGGGYKPNSGRSNGSYRNDSFGDQVYLQSTYELKCADILDGLGIKWIRPSFLNYIDQHSKLKKYYPDFYLIENQIYLDPKNDFLAKKDQSKIQSVIDYNKVDVYILVNTQINADYISKLVL